MDCVIVGGGIAGTLAALRCRESWPDKSVTLFETEREAGYYRALLPQFMAGKLEEKNLFFSQPAKDPLLTVRTDAKVKLLDRATQTLFLEDERKVHYERLILAHGGSPQMPGLLAGDLPRGIFPVRDLATARSIREWLPGHPRVVVFGGSLVAVKTAVHLRQAGLDVSVVVRREHVLLRVLTPAAAEVVEAHLHRMGITLLRGCSLESIGSRNGRIEGVKAGSRRVACDTLLVAAGSAPDTTFLEGTGLLENGELVVSPTLQTRDKKIFAAGDAATLSDPGGERISPRTWPQAAAQGKLAAENLYRSAPVPLTLLSHVNCMNLDGLSLVVLGSPAPGAEVVSYARTAEGLRRELFVLNNRLVGGALVGDISGAGPLHAMMNRGDRIGPGVEDLLRPHGKAVFPSSGYRKLKRRAVTFGWLNRG